MGEKGAFTDPTPWETHFQGLREAVAEVLKDRPGSPVAVSLLGLLRELVRIFPQLMETEDTRQDFLVPDFGDFFSFILRRPVPWDWETMTATLTAETVAPSGTEEDENMVIEWQGVKPANAQETAAFAALSKGLAWIITGKMKGPALFSNLQGLSEFPQVDPPAPASQARFRFGFQDMDIGENILKGLGRDRAEVLNSVMTHGPILPLGVSLGGAARIISPRGFLFDDDLLALLGVDSGAWNDLHFRGEIGGKAWESRFAITCRGLEVDLDEKTAVFILDISPTWGTWWEYEDPETLGSMQIRDRAMDEAQAMRTTALEWGPQEWTAWSDSIAATLTETMERLGGMGAKLQGQAVVTGTSSATLTIGGEARGEVGQPLPIILEPEPGELTLTGHAPTITISPFGVEEVEPVLRSASWTSDSIRTSHLAQNQLRALNSLARGFTKAKNLYREEESRIMEGVEILDRTGERPEWLLESRKKHGTGFELAKTEKDLIRKRLLGDRAGFFERDRGGTIVLVTGIPTAIPGEVQELHLGGEGLQFLNRQALKAMQDSARRELDTLEKREQTLADEVDRALIQPLDELQEVQRGMEKVRRKQEIYTSWAMAQDLFRHLVDEVAAQGRTTIEVDALALKDWMWPGGGAPDNWLQSVSETLALLFKQTAATAKAGKVIQGGSFITIRGTRHREHPTKPLTAEDTKGVRGGNLVYTILVNEALLGAIALLKTGTRTLPSGVETETLETGKLTKDQNEKVRKRGDRLGMVMAHMDALLKAQGFDEVETALAKHLSAYLTKTKGGVDRKWTTKPKGGKNPDGTIFRQYTSAFGCPFLPAPGAGFLYGALGTFDKSPERGWEMGGRPTPSKHKGGLLYHMGLELPQGADRAGRNRVYLKGLKALRRVVLDLGEGVLALKDKEGTWHDLGASIPEPLLVHLLQEGLIFPFLTPRWEEKIRAGFEATTGTRLARGTAEADKRRWETKPSTPETGLDGFPLHVLLAAELEKRGLSRAQGANLLGVSAPMVSLWINGKKPISKESASKIRAWIKGGP